MELVSNRDLCYLARTWLLLSIPVIGVLDGFTYHHFYDQATIADPVYSYDPLVLDKFIGM